MYCIIYQLYKNLWNLNYYSVNLVFSPLLFLSSLYLRLPSKVSLFFLSRRRTRQAVPEWREYRTKLNVETPNRETVKQYYVNGKSMHQSHDKTHRRFIKLCFMAFYRNGFFLRSAAWRSRSNIPIGKFSSVH